MGKISSKGLLKRHVEAYLDSDCGDIGGMVECHLFTNSLEQFTSFPISD
jgi:hypothetical protein